MGRKLRVELWELKGASMPHCPAYRLTYCLPACLASRTPVLHIQPLNAGLLHFHCDACGRLARQQTAFTAVQCTNRIFQKPGRSRAQE